MTGTAERPQGEIAPTGRKGTFDRRRLSKVLLRYFRESNKSLCAVSGTDITKRLGMMLIEKGD